MTAAKQKVEMALTIPTLNERRPARRLPTSNQTMEMTMHSNTPVRAECATSRAFSRMDAYQLLQATKTLVVAQQLSAFAFTAAQAINSEDPSALADWEEARMESLSDELFSLLQEFDRRKDLDADGQNYRDIAIAISHDVVVSSHWQVSVRRSA